MLPVRWSRRCCPDRVARLSDAIDLLEGSVEDQTACFPATPNAIPPATARRWPWTGGLSGRCRTSGRDTGLRLPRVRAGACLPHGTHAVVRPALDSSRRNFRQDCAWWEPDRMPSAGRELRCHEPQKRTCCRERVSTSSDRYPSGGLFSW